MDVQFRTNKLERCYREIAFATRTWGPKIARCYVDRVNRLHACRTADDLKGFLELRFHKLRGPREGYYALNLDGAWRLLVSFVDDTMTIVRVEEVSKHYGD